MMSENLGQIDLTLEARYPTRGDLLSLHREAVAHRYRAVVVPSSCVAQTYALIQDESLRICAQIGFPFGSADPDAKRYETEVAVDAGAHEIEVVPSIARLKEGDYKAVLREIRDFAEAADERPIKVVIEAGLWSDSELEEIGRMILDSGAHYLVISSDPLPCGAPELLARCQRVVGPGFGIKVRVSAVKEGFALVKGGADLVGVSFPSQ